MQTLPSNIQPDSDNYDRYLENHPRIEKRFIYHLALLKHGVDTILRKHCYKLYVEFSDCGMSVLVPLILVCRFVCSVDKSTTPIHVHIMHKFTAW